MKHGLITLALAAACACANAAEAPPPQPEPVAIGQTWTYKRVLKTPAATTESRTIFRLAASGGDRYVIEALPAQLTGRPTVWHKGDLVDRDSCMVDFYGTGSLGILNSCATAFEPGMDWNTETTVKGVRVLQRYQVVDIESVEVAAGSFQAIRIEAHWDAAKGKSAGTPSHRITYWYAPETRAMVRVHRRFLNAKGAVESEATEELERFRQNIAR